MNEKEIRLQQTKKVFDTIAKLISKNESCSYRYLIYDLLSFKEDAYCELISGLTITNMLVDYQQLKKQKDDIVEYIKESIKHPMYAENIIADCDGGRVENLDKLLRMLGERE